QPRPPRGARGRDPRDPHPSPARGADLRRICAAPGDRGQDGRPARARGDGAPHRVRASGAAARAAGDPMSAGGGEPRVFVEAPARASAELSGLPTDVTALAHAVDRGRRSGVGTWTFAYGGFVLEGGRTPGGGGSARRVAPLLARLPFPDTWRAVVAVPQGKP